MTVNVNGGLGFGSGVSTVNVANLSGSGNVTLTNVGSGAVTLNVGGNNQSASYGGVLSGLGGLTKAGTGVLTLAGTAHNYSGATTVTGGTLQLTAVPLVYVPVSNASFETPSTGDYVFSPTGASWNFVGSSAGIAYNNSEYNNYAPAPDGVQVAFLQGSGSISQDLTFANAGSYTISFESAYRCYYAANQIEVLMDGGTVGTVTPTSTDYAAYSLTCNIASAGTHTLELAGGIADGYYTSFVDVVTVSARVPNNNPLPTTTPLLVASGAAFELGGNNQRVASLSDYTTGSGGTVVNSNTSYASTLTLSATGGTSTFSGVIAGGSSLGTINLVMSGSGIQVLAGSNTYTGGTTINGGNLAVNGSLSSSSGVTVNSSGTLSGIGSVGSVTANSEGTVAPGFSGSGTLTASSLSFAASSLLSYTLGSGTATDSRLSITGLLTLDPDLGLTVAPGSSWGAGTYVLATYGSVTDDSSSFSGWTVGGSGLGSYSYSFSLSSGSLDLTVASSSGGAAVPAAVPEPGSLMLLGGADRADRLRLAKATFAATLIAECQNVVPLSWSSE